MTKTEIVEKVNQKLGFSKKDCADVVEILFEIIKETLEKGHDEKGNPIKIKISGFGNFVVRQKKSRIGRNPHTGETIEISARKVLTFKASQILKEAVNRGPQPA